MATLVLTDVEDVIYYILDEVGADLMIKDSNDANILTTTYPEGWGRIGKLSTAISPIPDVLNDIATAHGCIIEWARSGKIIIHADPWWPSARSTVEWPFKFADTNIRGNVNFARSLTSVTGVAVTCTDTDGNTLSRVVFPPDATGSGVQEITGLTIGKPANRDALAINLYWKLNNTDKATFRVKGVGDWCHPREIVYLSWNNVYEGLWVIERVNKSWSYADNIKSWTCDLELRKYFAG